MNLPRQQLSPGPYCTPYCENDHGPGSCTACPAASAHGPGCPGLPHPRLHGGEGPQESLHPPGALRRGTPSPWGESGRSLSTTLQSLHHCGRSTNRTEDLKRTEPRPRWREAGQGPKGMPCPEGVGSFSGLHFVYCAGAVLGPCAVHLPGVLGPTCAPRPVPPSWP